MNVYKIRIFYRDNTVEERTVVAFTQGEAIQEIYKSEWLDEAQVLKVTAKKLKPKKA